VTGASSGIGYHLASMRHGAWLRLGGRRGHPLDEAALDFKSLAATR